MIEFYRLLLGKMSLNTKKVPKFCLNVTVNLKISFFINKRNVWFLQSGSHVWSQGLNIVFAFFFENLISFAIRIPLLSKFPFHEQLARGGGGGGGGGGLLPQFFLRNSFTFCISGKKKGI